MGQQDLDPFSSVFLVSVLRPSLPVVGDLRVGLSGRESRQPRPPPQTGDGHKRPSGFRFRHRTDNDGVHGVSQNTALFVTRVPPKTRVEVGVEGHTEPVRSRSGPGSEGPPPQPTTGRGTHGDRPRGSVKSPVNFFVDGHRRTGKGGSSRRGPGSEVRGVGVSACEGR